MELISHGMRHETVKAISSEHELIHCPPETSNPLEESAIRRIPVPEKWKAVILRESTHVQSTGYVYRIENAFAFLFRVGFGQVRPVYATSCGHLLEYEESIPHLKRLGILDTIKSGMISKRNIENCGKDEALYEHAREAVLWSGLQINYTHFLLDELAHLAISVSSKLVSNLKPRQLSLVNHSPRWCDEWTEQLGCEKRGIESSAKLTVVRINQLIVPVVPTLPQRVAQLRSYVERIAPKRLSYRNITEATTINDETRAVIIVQSYSGKEARIRNIDEIMDKVSASFRVVLWKPEEMSTREKIEYLSSFRQKPMMVCMGSALMNCVLFAELFHRIIALVDTATVANTDYLHGGWSYYRSIYHMCDYVVGDKDKGSSSEYIASSTYSADQVAIHLCNAQNTEADYIR